MTETSPSFSPFSLAFPIKLPVIVNGKNMLRSAFVFLPMFYALTASISFIYNIRFNDVFGLNLLRHRVLNRVNHYLLISIVLNFEHV